jgi:hypothetical protein
VSDWSWNWRGQKGKGKVPSYDRTIVRLVEDQRESRDGGVLRRPAPYLSRSFIILSHHLS